jgi:ABC-2 type transport system permease protein
MNKTLLILKREYLTRVRKKSFIVTTLLVPLFMVGIMVIPAWLATRDDKLERTIAVYDETALFPGQFEQEAYTKFHFVDHVQYQDIRENLAGSGYYALLYIPANIYSSNKAQLSSPKQVPYELAEKIENKLSQIIENDKRQKVIDDSGIPDLDAKLSATKTRISVGTIKVNEKGEERKSSSMIAFITSYIMGFLIYFFVFMYGSMVMRSVMEEKKNRIVEVIISSVKTLSADVRKNYGNSPGGTHAGWHLDYPRYCRTEHCPGFSFSRYGTGDGSEHNAVTAGYGRNTARNAGNRQ